MKKNITVQIDEVLIKRSKHLAVEDDMSLSEWIAGLIKNAVEKKSNRETAKKKALELMKKPLRLGGKILSRDEMHEL